MTYTFKLGNKTYKVGFEEGEGLSVVSIDQEQKEIQVVPIDKSVYSILVGSESFTVGVHKEGKKIQVFYDGDLYEMESVSGRDATKTDGAGGPDIIVPMHSRVVKILKEQGEKVVEGESVVVVEAMKMESELKASFAGTVKEVRVKEGESVEKDSVLVRISPDEE